MSFYSKYSFSTEQNKIFFKKIIELFMSNDIQPNPVNYALCYEYSAGHNKRLIAELNELFTNKTSITQNVGEKLYKKYICDGALETIEKINFDLIRLVDQTHNSVATTSQKASEAGDHFEEKAVNIEALTNPVEIKGILGDIISETRSLAQLSQSLKNDLEESQKEMEHLRKELNQVKKSALTDALTGLLNRGAFDEMMTDILEQNTNSDVCLTLLDLDHFKNINDNFGHQIGDEVLRFTASILKKMAGEDHYVARYGGEEMAIIMANTKIDEAYNLCERIRGTLEKSRLKRKNSTESIGSVTISIGIASLKSGDTAESFISRADKALYASKEKGRNRTTKELDN